MRGRYLQALFDFNPANGTQEQRMLSFRKGDTIDVLDNAPQVCLCTWVVCTRCQQCVYVCSGRKK